MNCAGLRRDAALPEGLPHDLVHPLCASQHVAQKVVLFVPWKLPNRAYEGEFAVRKFGLLLRCSCQCPTERKECHRLHAKRGGKLLDHRKRR